MVDESSALFRQKELNERGFARCHQFSREFSICPLKLAVYSALYRIQTHLTALIELA
jgi:hypothetical protein